MPENAGKDIYFHWIEAVKHKGATVILDADGELLKKGIGAGPHLVKPNIHELGRLFGTEAKDVDQAAKYAERLARDYGIGMVVVSMGEKGALFVDKDKALLASAPEVDPQSTVEPGIPWSRRLRTPSTMDWIMWHGQACGRLGQCRGDDTGFPAGGPFCCQGT